jgi:hypothetical protein
VSSITSTVQRQPASRRHRRVRYRAARQRTPTAAEDRPLPLPFRIVCRLPTLPRRPCAARAADEIGDRLGMVYAVVLQERRRVHCLTVHRSRELLIIR